MPVEIKMPALSPTMEEGTLAKWLVRAGDTVKAGDILAEIETDKATMEFEAVDDGVLGEILVESGTDNVKVGTVIARMAEEASSKEEGPSPTPSRKPGGEASSQVSSSSPPSLLGGGGGSSSSPASLAPTPPDQRVEATPAAPAQASPAGTTPAAPTAVPGTKITVREALRDAMAEEMRADDRVFVMGEEVGEYQGAYKVTQGLLEEFGPGRVIDTPITEYGFAGLGAGAAMGGLRPIVEFMTFNFALQAIDHIINSAAKTNYMSGGQMRCPIVFRGPNGAATRVGAQHSHNFAAWYSSVPGLIVLAPYDAGDAKGLLKAAIRCEDPVVVLENELLYGRSFELPEGQDVVPIGRARTMREGRDVTIVSYSIGVGLALEAAGTLAGEGIEAEVIDLRTLRPLDRPAVLASLAKTNRMVVVEEGFPVCSIASEIISIAMEDGFDDLDAPVLRVTNEDVPMPYAANLERAAIVTADRVAAAVRSVCNRG